MIAGQMSSVEDPEKHFLGNLLDDDSYSAPCPSPSRRENATSSIPSVSVIAGVGPINANLSSTQSFWPEPPPPYSPSDNILSSSSWRNIGNNLKPLAELHTAIEEPSEWHSLLLRDPYSLPLPDKSSGLMTQTQIHHHHHNLHHHTHMHNIVENHHHYLPQMDMGILSPPPGFTLAPQAPRGPFSAVVSKSKENLRNAPHSAPVVHKMPFSYRDVAARNEPPSTGHSPPQQSRKTVVTPVESEQHRAEAVISQDTVSVESENSSSSNHRESKSKQEQEFQKISRKGKNSKDKKVLTDSVSLPLAGDEPPCTRFHLLETLTSPKIVKNNNVTDSEESFSEILAMKGRTMPSAQLVPVHSRSNSITPEDERLRRIEPKKKIIVTTVKRRGNKKQSDDSWWMLMFIWSYVMILVDKVSDGFTWLVSLIVDVCIKIFDISSFCIKSFFDSICNAVNRFMQAVLSTLGYYISAIRDFEFNSIFSSPELVEPKKWGLEDNMIIPVTADEFVARIMRLPHVDAYSVLGLRANCSDDDIKRHNKRIMSLLSNPDNGCDGCDEAADLVVKAYEALSEPEARKSYNLTTLHKNALHKKLVCQYNTVCDEVQAARNSMQCDCGHRHNRIATTTRAQEARYCKRCSTRHPAKPNEIWVESRFCGLLHVYMTYSEGTVYDVSDWASCEMQSNFLKNLKADAHTVHYRLVSPSLNDRLPARDCDVEESKGRNAAQVSFQPRDDNRSRRAAHRKPKR